MGHVFTGVEKLLCETFLPRLFFRKLIYFTPLIGNMGTMPVNKAGLSLKNTATCINKKSISSQRVITDMIWTVTGESELFTVNHLQALREEKHDKQKVQNDFKTPNSSTLFQILIQTSKVLS